MCYCTGKCCELYTHSVTSVCIVINSVHVNAEACIFTYSRNNHRMQQLTPCPYAVRQLVILLAVFLAVAQEH